MDKHQFISVEMFCQLHQVEASFISSLQEFELVELVQLNEEKYIPVSQLMEVERILRLKQDLDINTEGIDVTIYLLQKIRGMQEEIEALKMKLRLYEAEV